MIVKLRKPHTVVLSATHGKVDAALEIDLPGQSTYVAVKDGKDYVVSAELIGVNKRFALRVHVPESNVEIVNK